MKKLLTLTSVFLSLFAFAQTNEDSLHIVDLKTSLATAQGTSRVDILNDLAYEYLAGGKSSDSVNKYQQWAYQEAVKADYKHGLALSLLRLPGSAEEKRSNTQKALSIATQTNDLEVLGWAYYDKSVGGDPVENYKKSVDYFRKAGQEQNEAQVSATLAAILIYMGQYEEALPYAVRNIKITATKRRHAAHLQHDLILLSYYNMSELYKAAGDLEKSISYILLARNYEIQNQRTPSMTPLLANLYCKTNKPDSALYYLRDEPQTPFALLGLGEIYIAKGNHDEAITLLDRSIDSVTLPRAKPFYIDNRPFLMNAYLLKAKAYAGKKDFEAALRNLHTSDKNAVVTLGDIDNQLEKYSLYADVYQNLGRSDSAYKYLRKYTSLKDSVNSKKAIWNLSLKLQNLQATISAQKREAELALRDQLLNRRILVRNSLIAGLFFLLLIVFFAFRNLRLKRKAEKLQLQKELIESEQKRSELQRETVELEMQALRAQMNPHFIFNCLSSINNFIFNNDNEAASNYLTKFSRLIRLVLLQSRKHLITLEDELEMLRLYLDMERMRFKNGFDYSIILNNSIEAGDIFIPPLILQPFCENAIWHGLMHKEDGKGKLTLSITEHNGTVQCSIADNGVGREKAALYKSKSAEKEKSLGLKITKARLDLLNGDMGNATSFSIKDLVDSQGNVTGTIVNLAMNCNPPAKSKQDVESNHY